MAAPRLDRLPVKQESTPMVTGPVGRCEVEVLVLPHAARTKAVVARLAIRRPGPEFRFVFALTRFIVCGTSNRPSAAAFRARLVQPCGIVNGWTTGPVCLLNSAPMGAPPAASLRPLERSRLYEDVGERLAEFVRESDMAPGAQFPTERDLARQLHVSRTSVRQSFVVLQALGFVDVRHGEGVFLRRTRGFGDSLTKLLERRRRLPDVLEAREALEVKLAELAAANRGTDDLSAMNSAVARMGAEISAGGVGTEGDAAFHHAIALAARNEILLHLIEAMAEVIQESRIESLSEPGRPLRSLEAHRRILAAIESRNREGAAEAMRQHLRVVADVSLLRWQPEPSDDVDAGD